MRKITIIILTIISFNGLFAQQKNIVTLRHEAEEGIAASQYELGMKYFENDNLLDVGAEWIEKSANQGYIDAEHFLGILYRAGKGVTQDNEKAIYWLEKAATKGKSSAQKDLGSLYLMINKDTEAELWLRKAAIQNEKDALFLIGFLYESGRGVNKDLEEAKKWFKKACDAGNEKGCEKLN